MRPFALFLLLAFFSAPALAVYKCEIDGKVVYRDSPCAGGKELDIDAAPAKNGSVSTQEQLARDKAKAARLESERHRREAREAREQNLAARRAAARQKKCDSLALRTKWAEDDAIKASGKAAERARIKARHAAEKYELECGK